MNPFSFCSFCLICYNYTTRRLHHVDPHLWQSLKTIRGAFITTARFTDKAREYVQGIQKQIVLIDGDELARLMISYNVGVRDDRMVVIKKLDEDFFEA